MAKKSALLYPDNNWTFERLKLAEEAISEIAFKELKQNIYPNQIEIIGSDQMLDAYSSVGLPIMYNHWSFGKHFIQQEQGYRKGKQGLAYEIVINSNPCISYLMEENTMTMQALVIAHAGYGHNHFFKNNHLFKQWTDADSIIDYLIFAKNYIAKMEDEHGPETVEKLLDSCHAIMDHGVDRYQRPAKLNKQKEIDKQKARADEVQRQANLLWTTLPSGPETARTKPGEDTFPKEPHENLLYFIEKYSPVLKAWEREIVRIVRKLSQYFYPQIQTKVMNEGWASFTHYYIMTRLWENGRITDGNYLEFIHSHSSVLMQRPWNNKHYSGFNPYAIGFDIFMDIKRICENPTEEDKQYFPHIADQPWLETCLDAVENYRDESFFLQFLSPRVMKKWQLFELEDNHENSFYEVKGIQNNTWYDSIRQSISRQNSIIYRQPDIQIINANLKSTRMLELLYRSNNGVKLDYNNKNKVAGHMEKLWGYGVIVHEK